MRGTARDRRERVRAAAGAVVLTLALFLTAPAFAASVEASPVVTVPGSQVEGTVTINGAVVLSTSTVDALASAFAASQVPTVSVAPSTDDDVFRASVLVALAVCVALLGVLVGSVVLL